MDARNDIIGRIERSDGHRDRLAQIAALIGLPIDAFFEEADPTDLREILQLWDAAGDEARADILAYARAAAARSRDGRD